jgi:hypothetical protein
VVLLTWQNYMAGLDRTITVHYSTTKNVSSCKEVEY